MKMQNVVKIKANVKIH